jgi:thiol:disulfide interchange protein DsbD
MSKLLLRVCIWLVQCAALGAVSGPLIAGQFLEPEQAFRLTVSARSANSLDLKWVIAPDYHLYRERFQFRVEQGEAVIGAPKLPAGKRKFDTNFNKEVETFQDQLSIELPIERANGAITLSIGYQGCADAGLCYAPAVQRFHIDANGAVLAIADAVPSSAAPAQAAAPVQTSTAPVLAVANTAEDDVSLAQRTLRDGSTWQIAAAFLMFGLLLSLTPCVLPMVPILSSMIVGEGNVSRSRGFLLALAYSLGMALVYTALGVAAGLAGEGLAAALQKPWVLVTFATLLCVLALSMFDVYQLQLPSAWQSRLSSAAGGLRGGRYVGVFVMGALSALIVGPCVAGPLAGALLYISQTHNVWLGGWALFTLAAGMSVPLLLTGLSAGSILPRAGGWMNHVKFMFGLLLLGTAVWIVSPVLPAQVVMVLWGSLAILGAVFLRAFQSHAQAASPGKMFANALGLALLVIGVCELAGAASSGNDALQPLAHLRTASEVPAAQTKGIQFTRVRTLAELDQQLASAGQPVLLDVYADWCVACKEMERYTFSDRAVARRLQGVRLLQVDVTANSDADRAVLKRFGLFGPPGIVLFGADAQEIKGGRVYGYQAPLAFLNHLQRNLPN